jgi:hypothetical protein
MAKVWRRTWGVTFLSARVRNRSYTRRVGALNVDPIALQTLAATCQGWSAELAVTSAPRLSAAAAQATAAAVAAVHADTGRASAAFSARMQSTATKLVASSVKYTSNEEASASRLANLTVDL